MSSPETFLEQAIELSMQAVQSRSGGPFGAVIVRNDQLLATGYNQVVAHADPTAHAEVQAIRAACAVLGDHRLEGCTLYASCEPCPMCLAAIYWARIERVWYANTRADAAAIGFGDAFLYEEMTRPLDARRLPIQRLPLASALRPLEAWHGMPDRTLY